MGTITTRLGLHKPTATSEAFGDYFPTNYATDLQAIDDNVQIKVVADAGEIPVFDVNGLLVGSGILPEDIEVGLIDSILTDQGMMLYRDAAALAALAPSTDGMSLITKGAAANPIFGYPSHSTLLNLSADTHSQYHNDTRGDIRYPLKSLLTTHGDIPYRNAAGAWDRLAPTFQDQPLWSGGVGGNPAFADLVSRLTVVTDAPDGANDKVAIYDNSNSGSRAELIDNFAKRNEQIFIGSQAMWPAATAGSTSSDQTEFATNKQYLYRMGFNYDTLRNAQCQLIMPTYYDAGTVTAKFFWYSTGTTTNGVRWGLKAVSYGNGDAIDASYGTAQEVTDNATATAGQLLISSATSALTIASAAAGEFVIFDIYRNPTHVDDTLNEIAYLIGLQITFGRNKWSA